MTESVLTFTENSTLRKKRILKPRKRETQIRKFLARVDKNGQVPDQTNPHYFGLNGCWIWLGAKSIYGYGHVMMNWKVMGAHRASFILFKGDIPEGLYICHRCDRKICVNPEHLFLGTPEDNEADKLRKGRQARGDNTTFRLYPEKIMRGEKNPKSKVTEADVREMRRLYSEKMSRPCELQKRFNISGASFYSIINRTTWRHVK